MKQMFDYKIMETITQLTASSFINFLESTKLKTIKVLLFTDGGNGEAAMSIKNYIEYCKLDVHFYCIGCVESAGLIILSAGTKKFAFKDCTFMTHKPIAGNGSKKHQKIHEKKLQLYLKIIQNITPKVSVTSKIEYLTTQEALQHKVIDKIL